MPSAEEQLDYVLTVLKHTELAQPDYHAVAAEVGAKNANKAQIRFRTTVEARGFRLVNKQVVSGDGSGVNAVKGGPVGGVKTASAKKKGVATPKPRGRGRPPKAVANKKRKRAESEESASASADASADVDVDTGAGADAGANGKESDGEEPVITVDDDEGMTDPEDNDDMQGMKTEGGEDNEAVQGANGRARSETITVDDEE